MMSAYDITIILSVRYKLCGSHHSLLPGKARGQTPVGSAIAGVVVEECLRVYPKLIMRLPHLSYCH